MSTKPFISYGLSVLLMCVSVACKDKAVEDHVWDQYHTTPEATDGYIDNDEYYVPPTGGYVPGGMLDPD
jgi:hypothetical protein